MASNEGHVKHRRCKLESLGRLPLQTLNQLVRDNLSTDSSTRMWSMNANNEAVEYLRVTREWILSRTKKSLRWWNKSAHAAVTRTTTPVLRAHHQEVKKQIRVTKYAFFRPGLGIAEVSRTSKVDVLSVHCRSESARQARTNDRRDM